MRAAGSLELRNGAVADTSQSRNERGAAAERRQPEEMRAASSFAPEWPKDRRGNVLHEESFTHPSVQLCFSSGRLAHTSNPGGRTRGTPVRPPSRSACFTRPNGAVRERAHWGAPACSEPRQCARIASGAPPRRSIEWSFQVRGQGTSAKRRSIRRRRSARVR